MSRSTAKGRKWLDYALRAQQHRTQQAHWEHLQAQSDEAQAQQLCEQRQHALHALLLAWSAARETGLEPGVLEPAYDRSHRAGAARVDHAREALEAQQQVLASTVAALGEAFSRQQAYEALQRRFVEQQALQLRQHDERAQRDQGPAPRQRSPWTEEGSDGH